MFEVVLPLQVEGHEGDLEEEIERVVAELAALDDCKDELLDYAVSLNQEDDTVEFEVTVQADEPPEALSIAISCVRAAIHATGAGTPGWDDHQSDDARVVYQVDSEEGMEIRPVAHA